jgi:hypothetical protein
LKAEKLVKNSLKFSSIDSLRQYFVLLEVCF